MNRKAYPSDVSDEEWAFVAPYLTFYSLASNFSLDLQSTQRSLGSSPSPCQPPFSVGIALSTGLWISLLIRSGWHSLFGPSCSH
jgi:hypothetical protein